MKTLTKVLLLLILPLSLNAQTVQVPYSGTVPYSGSVPVTVNVIAPGCTSKVAPGTTLNTITVTVTCPVVSPPTPLSITTPITLPAAKVGIPYSANLAMLANPKGGTAPYTYSATGLPAGITLSPAGIFSGTPTTAGTTNFTFTVKDSSVQSGVKANAQKIVVASASSR